MQSLCNLEAAGREHSSESIERPVEPSAALVLVELRLEVIELQQRVAKLMLRLDGAIVGPELCISTPQSMRLNAVALAASEFFGFPLASIMSHARPAEIAWARMVAYMMATEFTGLSSVIVGRFFHRDHSTIGHGIKSVNARCATSAAARQEVDALRFQLRKTLGE